ncbi:hypothetical protein A616_17130 [Brevibacillus brevis X23]|nr:hypothetical protein A616_17130 [Brevibacillus brevis X23]
MGQKGGISISLVLELQREAVDGKCKINDLLRKALMVAKKLKVRDFEAWINNELNGYKGSLDSLPDYREIRGVVTAKNPYNGLNIPAIFSDEKLSQSLTVRKINISVGEIEHLLGQTKTGYLQMNFPDKTQEYLMKYMEFPMVCKLDITASQFQKIIEAVRAIVLNWSLKLEEDGVLGEGMSFSKRDEETAAKSTAQIITNNNIFNSSGGNIQLQQHTENSTQTNTMTSSIKMSDLNHLIESLKKMSKEVHDTEQKEILESDIGVLELQVKSPKPKLNVIAETLKSVRNISEGITGSLVASNIQEQVASLLGQIMTK